MEMVQPMMAAGAYDTSTRKQMHYERRRRSRRSSR
jgi:hypothetical protein